jgi:hypothetical protein
LKLAFLDSSLAIFLSGLHKIVVRQTSGSTSDVAELDILLAAGDRVSHVNDTRYAVARAGRFGGLAALQESSFSGGIERLCRQIPPEKLRSWGGIASPRRAVLKAGPRRIFTSTVSIAIRPTITEPRTPNQQNDYGATVIESAGLPDVSR